MFRSSYKEGVHEIDTLIRIHANIFAAELRDRLRGNANVLQDIAKLRDYRATEESAQVGSAAWELQREELYEPANYINGCNTPLEAGDVFQFEAPDGSDLGRYVLLAQPCDLMVRSREKAGQRKATIAMLAPIQHRSMEEDESGVFELPLYSGGSSAVVNLHEIRNIDIRVLDLCVLNQTGSAEVVLGDAVSGFSTGWNERVSSILMPFAKVAIEAWEAWYALPPDARGLDSELPAFSITLDERRIIKTDVVQDGEKRTLQYGIKRVNRLSNGLAAELLQAFGDHLSRPARPHSLSGPSVC